MTRADVSDYLEFKHMPSGRHVFALTQTRDLVVKKQSDSSALVPVIDDAIAAGRKALRVEFDWQSAKKLQADTSRGDAQGLKHRITRQLSSLYAIVDGRTEGDDDVAVKARELKAAIFPNGVKGHLESDLRGHARDPADHDPRASREDALADDVKTVGVEREVGILKDLTARFADALAPQPAGLVLCTMTSRRRSMRSTRPPARSSSRSCNATSKRNFVPAEGSDSDVGRRSRPRPGEQILAPINFQQELVTEAYSRHKMPLDVNPDTGEEY